MVSLISPGQIGRYNEVHHDTELFGIVSWNGVAGCIESGGLQPMIERMSKI